MTQPSSPELNPYAAPEARVVDQESSDQQELADRGIRLGAAIVDYLIFFVVGLVGGIAILSLSATTRHFDPASAMYTYYAVAGVCFAALGAINCVLLHKYGQSIAKRLFSIKIVRSDGSRCGLLRLVFARWLPVTVLTYIPVLGFLVFLLDALLIFREDYRCLHDHFADTVVVKV